MNSTTTAETYTTLLDVVRFRASARSGTAHLPAFTYLNDGEQVSGSLSYAELDAAARRLAAHLQQVTRRGDRVLLVYPPSLDYIIAFYACVYAGVTAVPALPPSNPRTLPRLCLQVEDAQPAAALTSAAIEAIVAAGSAAHEALRSLRWIATDELAEAATPWQEPVVGADDLVFLQYTSGSTGAPKGVMVSHRNLLANLALSQRTYGMRRDDVFVSWLPPHHDFGLIGAIISPLYVGCHSVQFPPAAFLMRPHRWLKLISAYRARITGAPNFAFQLCTQRVTPAQQAELDLSCLEVAVNGAERIRLETLREFAQTFAACGLRPEALTPAYGMAEAVLLACAATERRPGQLPRSRRLSKAALEAHRVADCAPGVDSIDIVCTGMAASGEHRMVCVDPQSGAAVPENTVGEVWLAGPSVASGYWRKPEAAGAVFDAALADGAGGWLRTGDLGFIDEGRLYLTGRIKEMMIFNGRNVYPQDVEQTVERLDPAFRANACAVFALEEEGRARLAVVQEVEARQQADTSHLVAKLRAALAEHHDIVDLAAVLLVKAGRIPRTSSGKLQRVACRQWYLEDRFEPLWSWRDAPDERAAAGSAPLLPLSDTEQRMLALWETLFERSPLAADENFFRLGGHSLLGTQLIAAVNAAFGVSLPLSALFHAPTVRGLAAMVANAGSLTEPALVAGEQSGPWPLSYAQQRFWFLDQYQPGNCFYAIPLAIHLGGDVEPALLEQALNLVVARHSVLRTCFPAAQGLPHQSVLPSLSIPLCVTDLRTLEPAEAERQSAALVRAEASRPFDLARGPLLRAGLQRLPAGRHVLLLTLHHIVHDGGSTPVLLDELRQLYRALRLGGTPALAQPPLQYSDYTQWEQRRYAGEQLASALQYWRDQLAGVPPLLALPTDRARSGAASQRGAAWQTRLPKPLVQALEGLARDSNATLFMVLTAAMNALLYRYCGQSVFAIGALSANRPAGAQAMLGNFVNVVPLRAQVQRQQRFRDLLSDTAANLLAAHDRQLPFELVLQHVAPERSAAFIPYAQVVLNFHSEFDGQGEASLEPGEQTLSIEGRHPASVQYAAFDLKLEINRVADGLDVVYEYNTDLFDAATIAQLGGHYARVLQQCCASPDLSIGSLDLLDEAELAALAAEWQAALADYPRDAQLAQLLERQAARTPQAVAVAAPGVSLTYAELHARANRLAHALRAQGVGAGDLVGLCAERSPEMVVAVLAVVKAGAAYLPLDPDYPAARLAYMLEDAAPALVLTQPQLAGRLPAGVPWLAIGDGYAPYPDSPPAPLGHHADPLYVIYTSGSTGKPKGVVVHRRGFVNLLTWFTREYQIADADRVLLLSSFSFDLTQKNIFGILLAGGQLHLLGDEYAPQRASSYIGAQGVTLVNCAPSAFYPLLADGGAARMACLRKVFLGGEPIQADLLHAAYRELAAPPMIHNTYGPTEASDVVSHHAWHPHEPVASVPIGRAIANTRLYVLDEGGKLVPRGAVGELYIGGDGVGLGYLKRAALTAERFLPDPFAADPQARMYRSGDLVRRLPDGALDYIGRVDHQVKIRGFRIEIGEIEEALRALPEVRQALVVARTDLAPDAVLVAYLVATDGKQVCEVAALRAALARSLPQFMLPSYFVQLAAFPLSPNGKIDRHALPLPERSDTPLVAPASPTEQALAAIWATVLKCGPVGAHDDFFQLGGHSLLATQVVSQIRSRLGVELALRTLFEYPVLSQLAAHIDAADASQAAALSTLEASDSLLPAPLSFAEQRLWLLHNLGQHEALYNLPFAVELAGQLDIAALQGALDAIAQRHAALRTSFGTADGQPLRQLAAQAALPVQHTVLDNASEAELQDWLQQRASQPFDLVQGPLARADLLQLAPQRHVLLLTMHHIIADGWSLSVLGRELSMLYNALLHGRAAALPALPLQYGDYCRWQHARSEQGAFDQQLAYWERQLADAPAMLALPTDHARPAHPAARGDTLAFVIEPSQTQALQQLAREAQASLFMVLHAAFGLLLARYSGQSDLCIGTPIANRHHGALEGLIGFFVNTLVLRIQVDGSQDFRALLGQVRGTALEAFANQDVPFERVVGAIARGRQAGQTPLFQAMLALQNAPMEALALDGLAAHQRDVHNGGAKFDLTLNIAPRAARLECFFEYDCALFERATVDRLAQNFLTLLSSIAAAPDQPMRTLAMLAPPEQALLMGLGDGGRARTQPLVHVAFAEHARRAPQQPAIVHGDSVLSYGELDRRAERLARALASHGVGVESRVALYAERGIALIVGVLAIWKAGGVYVPFDPAYPADRLAHMAQDCAPAVLLTEQAWCAQAQALSPVLASVPSCLIDAPSGADLADMATPAVAPHHLAYMIYTSGSTGLPKGVLIEHGGLANLAAEQNAVLQIGPGSRVLQFASISFDASIWEIVMALASGATLVSADRTALLPGPALLSVLREQRLTHALLPPSVLAAMQDDGQLAPMTLLVGGEACPLPVAERWGRRHRFVNAYGPTEITVCATTWHYDGRCAGGVPIGRPLAGSRIYVLDEGGQLLPKGATGEIYIAGAGVARAYWQRAELSGERFLPEPGGGTGRMYRTGDLGRWGSDGMLYYAGRNDFQVKVRGFRIELGEIEAQLRALPQVADAAVIARADAAGQQRLLAYVVAGAAMTPAALRSALLSRLPDYMVPAAFVAMDALPQTANGKLDRDALPLPQDAALARHEFVAPQEGVERRLAAIWQSVLGVAEVGRFDQFFELGGHSLALTKLSFLVQESFGVTLSLGQLYQLQELAQQAGHIAQALADASRHSVLVLDLDDEDEEAMA